MRISKNQSGVTLMEVVIGLAVAWTTIFSLIFIFPKMKVLRETGHHKTAAIRACQTKLEFIRNSGFSVINAGTTQEVVTLESGENLASTADDLLGVLTTRITNIFGDGVLVAKKILVQCQWVDHHTVVNEYGDLILYRNVL